MSIKFLCGIDVDNGVLYTDTSNNRVGINVSSPQVPLEAKYSGTEDEIIRIVGTASGKPQMTFYNDTTLHTKIVAAGNNDFSITNTHSTGNMFFATGGATRLHIESDGKVGIGTTSPSRALQVIGTDGAAKFYYNSSFTNAQYSVVDVGMMTSGTAANGFGPKITFRMGGNGYDGYVAGNIGTTRNGADNTHNLTFGTSNAGSTTTKMVLTNAGNLGIGTTAPSQKLHVVGTGLISNGLYIGDTSSVIYRYFNSFIIQNTASTTVNIGGGPGAVTNNLDVNGTIRGKNYLYLEDAGGTLRTTLRSESTYATLDNGSNTFNYVASNHLFLVGASEKMRINSSGNVGIGTTAPGAKLEVNGNSRFVGSMQFYQGSTSNQYLNILQSSSNTYINTGTSGETIYFGAPAANTTNLNVQGTITATATTDAYKGYIKQAYNCSPLMKTASSAYNFVPFNSTIFVSSADYYNRMVAPYDGRVKKVILKHTGGATPTATNVNFKKHINDVTSSTIYTGTVTGGAAAGMRAEYNFSNTDFTFSDGDTIGVLIQGTGIGTTKTLGGMSVQIIVEYNIT